MNVQNRREFIKLAGGGLIGAMILPLHGCESNSVEPITGGRRVSLLTEVEDFYFKNGAEISISDWQLPQISRDAWRLRIFGEVANETEISYADLEARSDQQIEFLKTMRCVIDSNEVQGLIGTALWRGVPLKGFMDDAGIDLNRTRRIRFHGADRFGNNIKVDRMYGTFASQIIEPILVTHMNDLPLPAENGAPVRLMLNESFGYKNVKWLTGVEATSSDEPFGTYQDADFVDDGVMRVNSRTTNPLQNSQLRPGEVIISGFAVSGSAGVDRVEISIDGGNWRAVDLISETDFASSDPRIARALQVTDRQQFTFPYLGVWRTWDYQFTATLGEHEARIRAFDTAGNEQPLIDEDGIADGVNGAAILNFTVA